MEALMMKRPAMRRKLEDIMLDISWAKVAMRYFGRPPSWIHQKIDGMESPEGFTPAELEQLKGALTDLAERIRRVADDI